MLSIVHVFRPADIRLLDIMFKGVATLSVDILIDADRNPPEMFDPTSEVHLETVNKITSQVISHKLFVHALILIHEYPYVNVPDINPH